MSKVKFRQNTLSAREMRRIGEREAERQKRQASVDAFWALTPEERKQRMADNEAFRRISRNGITIDDLKTAEENGRKIGFESGVEETMLSCWAAVCLALHELHGYGQEECMAVLHAADQRVVYALNSRELLDEARDVVGMEFNVRAGMDEERVIET